LSTDTMESITIRNVFFRLKMTDDGRGFEVLMSKISVSEEAFDFSPGLPRKLAKAVDRQPKFGLLRIKVTGENNISLVFDKPVSQMSDDTLERHVFTPMARKIRRSHQVAQSKQRKQRSPHGRQRYRNDHPVAQGSM
jgi:hypothetical protein